MLIMHIYIRIVTLYNNLNAVLYIDIKQKFNIIIFVQIFITGEEK